MSAQEPVVAQKSLMWRLGPLWSLVSLLLIVSSTPDYDPLLAK